ncbi:MAG: hypothetical protein P4L83_23470 [Nevskia sp.]|nr:hypothetical protein [Nevskia sp.]
MIRSLLCALVVVALTGCGARGFKKEGAGQEDFDRDLRQCEYQVNVSTKTCIPGVYCDVNSARNFCMEQKGWTITRESGRYMAH